MPEENILVGFFSIVLDKNFFLTLFIANLVKPLRLFSAQANNANMSRLFPLVTKISKKLLP